MKVHYWDRPDQTQQLNCRYNAGVQGCNEHTRDDVSAKCQMLHASTSTTIALRIKAAWTWPARAEQPLTRNHIAAFLGGTLFLAVM